MKQTLDRHFIRLRALGRTLVSLRPSQEAVVHIAAAFLLCGIGGNMGPLYFGAALLCVCGKQLLLGVSLGLSAGYCCFWGFSDALPGLCICGLLLLTVLLLPRADRPGMAELAGGGVSLLVGGIVLAFRGIGLLQLTRFALQVGSAVFGAHVLRLGIREHRFPARVLTVGLVCLGLTSIALPGDGRLSVAMLAWLACAPQGLLYCAVCSGIISTVYPAQALLCTVFCLAPLVYRLCKKPLVGVLCVSGFYCLWGLLLKSYSFPMLAIFGNGLSLLLLPSRFLPAPSTPHRTVQPIQKQLSLAAQALEQAGSVLTTREHSYEQELSLLTDHACAQVCGSCARQAACPLPAQLSLSPQILVNGHALRSDLPEDFPCLHADAFLTGLNDGLDCTRSRRRLQSRARELKSAAGSQYALLSDFLRRLSGGLYAPEGTVNYAPELSVHAAGRGGASHSGDRGTAFAGPNATYYVLLCDGMGTGTEAAQESQQGVTLLRQLLQAGMEPEGALCTLNNLYLLRDNGCFATMDLARINLTSGDAILYKWGAAPSYLKRQNGLRSLGSASLPPGFSQKKEIQQLRLSLNHGSVLILTSDGLAGKETLSRLEACQSLLPRDVVQSLFVGRSTPEDDCTAVALRLRPAGT